MKDFDRATNAHLLPDKPWGATSKSLIVLDPSLSLKPLYRNFQILTSRRSQAYRPPYQSS
jgi:hypothetical protein